MSRNFTTSIVIRGIDQISGVARRVTNNFSIMKKSLEVGSNLRRFAADTSMAAQSVNAFAQKIRAAAAAPTEAFEGFEHEMARVKGLTKTAGVEFDKLYNTALQLGSSIGEFSALDAAKGMSEYGMAGYKANQITAAMPRTLDLSTAAQVGLADTIGVTTGIMGAFGLEANQIGRTADVLTATFTGSKTTLRSLGETMSYVGSVSRSAGVSLEETAVMAGMLGDASISGSRAGTTLKAMILRLAGAGRGKGAKILAALGIQIEKMKGGKKVLRGPLEMLTELHAKVMKFGPAARTRILSRVFGSEALPGVQQLMQNLNSLKLKQLAKDVYGAAGATSKLAKTMRSTAKNATLEMKSAIDGLYIKLGTQLAPTLTKVKNFIRDMVIQLGAWSDKHPGLSKGIMITMAGVAGLATALTGLMWTVSTVASGLGVLAPVFGVVGTAAQLAGAAALNGGLAAATGWAAALWPVALVVAAIAAVGAAGYALYRYWDPIKAWFVNMWERFKKASLGAKIVIAAVAVGIGAAIWIVLGPIALIPAAIIGVVYAIKHWDKIKKVAGDVWGWVKEKAGGALDWIKETVASVVDWVSAKFEKMMQHPAFRVAMKIANVATKPLQWLGKGVGMHMSAMGGAAKSAYGVGKEAFGVVTGAGHEPGRWKALEGERGIWTQQRVGGEIKISIDSEGRTRVDKVAKQSGDVDFDVDLGYGASMAY